MKQLTSFETQMKKVGQRYRGLAPDGMKWVREKEFALTLLSRTKKLQQATPESFGGAILEAASMGLTLNPAVQHCYIIPRGQTRGSDVQIAYASPSYRGLVQLAIDGGMVEWAKAEVIFDGDHYVDNGPVEIPTHRPMLGRGAKRGEQNAWGVYCVAKLSNGDCLREFMDRDQIMAVRNKSEFPKSALWTVYWTEGWKKAVIRRAQKTWPRRSSRFNQAIEVLNTHEGNIFDGTANEEEPAIVLVNDTQIRSFYTLLEEYDIQKKDFSLWLGRLAQSQGVDSIDMLPQDHYETVFDVLKGHLIARKESNKEAASED